VEVDVIRASAIVALFPACQALLGITVLIGLCPVTAAAESAQVQSIGAVQTVATTEPHVDSAAAGASTVLKTSTSRAQPVTPIPGVPVSSPVSQPGTASGLGAPPSKTADDLINAAMPVTNAGANATKMGKMAAASPLPGPSSASAHQPTIDGLELLTPAQRRIFQRAASTFTPFCHDWERLLHEREVNNLSHLSWRKDGGLQTATYTGYGKVESCECKASREGLPIGKIRYEERNYSIAGKTTDQARHAAPKLTHEISTLEIFSWDKGKWFY
jgi:hypothetical protein